MAVRRSDEETGEDGKEKINNGGGCCGCFKKLWLTFIMYLNAFKWILREFLTRHNKLNMQKIPKRSGDIAVITGGGRGIGLHVIKKLLQCDMHVIMGVRNEAIATDALDKLRDEVTSGSYEIIPLDLTSLSSVRQFANTVLGKVTSIHLLINNAGIMLTPYDLTRDDQESQFQVNYLSHFLLTCLLLPKLVQTGTSAKHSRVINVSSCAQNCGNLNFDDLQMKKFYSSAKAYMDSKLAQVISSNYLARRIRTVDPSGPLNINFYSVHPGVIYTDLYQHVLLIRIFSWLLKLIWKSPEQGSDGIAFAALSPDAEALSGSYLANCKKYRPNNLARNVEIQEKLWEVSTKLVNLPSSDLHDILQQTNSMEPVEVLDDTAMTTQNTDK